MAKRPVSRAAADARNKATSSRPAAPRRRYAAHEWTSDTPVKWQERGPDGRLSDRPRRGPDGRLIGW